MDNLKRSLAKEIHRQLDNYKGYPLGYMVSDIYNKPCYTVEGVVKLKDNLETVLWAIKKYQENTGEPYNDVDDTDKLWGLTLFMVADEVVLDLVEEGIESSVNMDDKLINKIRKLIEELYDITKFDLFVG